MIILGIIMLVAGVASYVYGDQMNNSIEIQFKSLFNNGTTNPGSIFVTVGIVVAVIGVILIVVGCIKKFKGNNDNGQVPNELIKTQKKYCPHCGAEIDADSKFCSVCGSAVIPATPAETITPQTNYTYSTYSTPQTHTREWVEKTRKNAKTLKIIMIVSLFVPLFGVMIAMVIGLVYLNKYGYFLRSIKDLEKSNRLDYVNDIPINTSTFVVSKIDCGTKAMYFQKIHQIIAYEDVLWIYIKRQNNNFFGLTVSSIETVEIWCRNKRHLSISAGRDEISQLINDYISKASPSLLVGYTPENTKQYSVLKNR